MKTLFDWLMLPKFRERPGMVIGSMDLDILQIWISGYMTACKDAGEEWRVTTPNGVPISLFSDYVAITEKDSSTAAFAYILKEAANGQEREAWDRFYVRLEEFMGLTIRNVWRMLITEKMKTANTGYIRRMEQKPDGTYGPAEYRMIALRKIVLSNGLCWVMEEYPDHEIMGSYEDVWDPCSRYGSGHLVWESSADSRIRSEFGEVNWEPYTEKNS